MPGLFDPEFDPSIIEGEGLPLDVAHPPAPAAANGKTDWKRLAPLLAALPLALKRGGRVGGAALLRGFERARQQSVEETRRASADAEGRAYRQASLSSQAEARRATADAATEAKRQTFFQQFNQAMDGLDNPADVEAQMPLWQARARSLGLTDDPLQFAPTPVALNKRKAAKALAALQKARPDDWQNWSVSIDGKDIPSTEVAGIVRSPGAPPVAAKDKRGFAPREITLNGRRMMANFDPDSGNYYAIGETTRPLSGTILDYQKPSQSTADPETAALRRETAHVNLELLRQRVADATGKASSVKLSPAQQGDLADAKTLSDMAAGVLDVGSQNDWDGTGGLGYGSLAAWAAKNLGTGTDAAAGLRANISNIQATIAKLRGGTSFTPNEQRLLEQYTPTINEEPKSLVAKLKNLQMFLAQKAENMIAAASRGAGDLVETMKTNAAAPVPAKTTKTKVGRFEVEIGP